MYGTGNGNNCNGNGKKLVLMESGGGVHTLAATASVFSTFVEVAVIV